MDSLDFAIYRFLARGGEARFWVGRRALDPLVTPREISERVGISESGVRTRLRRLAEEGYLRDKSVVPNPSLFGKQVFVADIPVRQSGEVDHILRDLSLVEGVLFVRDVLDERRRSAQVHFVADGERAAARLAALLGRLAPEGQVLTPRAYYIPSCDRELTPLDWRVLQGVWHYPEATFAEIAETVGIALKTAARCYRQLVDSRACWWTHGPESEEFPLALVRIEVRSPADRGPTQSWVLKEAPAWMPVAQDGFGVEPDQAPTTLAGLLPADAPTALERFLRKLASLEGVEEIRRTFPLGSASYSDWFTDRITSQVRARS